MAEEIKQIELTPPPTKDEKDIHLILSGEEWLIIEACLKLTSDKNLVMLNTKRTLRAVENYRVAMLKRRIYGIADRIREEEL